MKKFGVTILFCFSLSSLILFYQNCGGQGPSNSLCFGGDCSIKNPSQGCPSGTNYIAASQSCQSCQYGYNSALQSCNPMPTSANPSFTCAIYAVNSQVADTSRNCATGCTLNSGESLKCEIRSFVAAPNDNMFACMESDPTCNLPLDVSATEQVGKWFKSTTQPGTYNYTYINNHQGSDVQQNTKAKDTLNRFSLPTRVLIKGASGAATNFGPQTFSLTCVAGNNSVASTSQALALPSGVNASDLRFTNVSVTNWSNNGFSSGSTYTNPPIFQASFSGASIVFQCNQAAATVSFTVATGQGGNTSWQITNSSQLVP